MIAIGSVLIVTLLYVVVERFATAALVVTGLPVDVARFQARSALAGVGFTTSEADLVVHHPVRRRIVASLMLLGGAGLVTLIASLLLSFLNTGSTSSTTTRLYALGGGLLAIWGLAHSRVVDRALQSLIQWMLGRWTTFTLRDYSQLLELHRDYSVAEVPVEANSWLASTPLTDLELPEEGVLVLGIRRSDGTYLGAPAATTVIDAGDTVVLYGRSEHLTELDQRRRGTGGDEQHKSSVALQEQIVQQQILSDRQYVTRVDSVALGESRADDQSPTASGEADEE